MKHCNKCDSLKTLDNFTKDSSKKDGLRSICRCCDDNRRNDWAQLKPKKNNRTITNDNGITIRICCKCKVSKEINKFYSLDTYNCIECCKRITKDNRYKKYGLTKKEFDMLEEAQDKKCAICRAEPPILCIDHDHKDGRVRGLLCSTCNSALGLFKEDVDILLNATTYLISSRHKLDHETLMEVSR